MSGRLTAAGVRIRVFMLYTSYVMNVPQYPQVVGTCKLVVDDHEAARAVLREIGFTFREEKALLLRTPEPADMMPVILERLATAGLNLIDAYGVLSDGGEGLVILSVSDEHTGFEIASSLDWSAKV